MNEVPCRPFRMSDAMILIAATALALADFRMLARDEASGVIRGFLLVVSLLTTWSIAVAGIAASTHRLAWPIALTDPGHVACLVGAACSGPFSLLLPLAMNLWPGRPDGQAALSALRGLLLGSGAVSLAWSVMAIGSNFLPRRSWPGWMGLGVGIAWIATFLVLLTFLILDA